MFSSLVVLALAAVPATSFAGAEDTPNDRSAPKVAPSPPIDGLWPSEKLMNSLLHRWADGVMEGYELDDQRRGEVRKAIVDRWHKFLQDNRSKIQPLINEFIEMRVAAAPPTKNDVQSWAKQALPVFNQLRKELTAGMNEVAQALNPDQRAKFERDVLQVGLGTQIAERKLKEWESGNFDVDDFWAGPPGERRRKRRERRQEAAKRMSEQSTPAQEVRPETDHIAIELKAWDRYAAEFIGTYRLDEGQRTAVLSCLAELKERAVAHRDGHREEIAELEQRIRTNTGGDEELAAIKVRLVDLYGPIDEMFNELRRRLDLIPNSEQRLAAQERRKKD
ncbi:MAG: hypothetical protein ACE5HE_03100 [Phycisphaerae bacterium]